MPEYCLGCLFQNKNLSTLNKKRMNVCQKYGFQFSVAESFNKKDDIFLFHSLGSSHEDNNDTETLNVYLALKYT